MGESALCIPPCVYTSLSEEVSGSSLAFSFSPKVPMNCGGGRRVRAVTSSERNHFKSLFDWPLLEALPLAIPQKGEVSVKRGGNKY